MAFPPSYAWTWKYSPNCDSVSFQRVRSNSISFQRSTSSSSSRVRCPQDKFHMTPIQCQDKSNVTASYETPSTMPHSDHHSAPPLAPTTFSWTFNPQNEIATFRRLPKSAPSPSPQPPPHNQPLPSETLAEGTDLPNAAPVYTRSLQSPCLNPISSRPSRLHVLRLSKRHRDALKVNLYHLYANILLELTAAGTDITKTTRRPHTAPTRPTLKDTMGLASECDTKPNLMQQPSMRFEPILMKNLSSYLNSLSPIGDANTHSALTSSCKPTPETHHLPLHPGPNLPITYGSLRDTSHSPLRSPLAPLSMQSFLPLAKNTNMVDSNAVATPVKALSGTPANFRRTYNPQGQSVVFHRLPKPVSRITKRHRAALKITMYHLYTTILSMHWF
eukprot:jgi/Psemu1/15128/gm1.15128_g